MDFTLTDEQRMFAEAAKTVFTDTCDSARLRELMESDAARDDARWEAIVENGFTQILLPESAGGLGLAETDFALIAEAAGYAALPDPLVESAGVATPMLAAIAPDSPVLADPMASVAIEHPINPYVVDADLASVLLLHADGATHVVQPSTVTLTRVESIDTFRRLFKVDWTPTAQTQVSDDASLWDLALDRGALFAAAQGLGAAQRAIDLATEYAKGRTQFGKPIGSYQAVKHQLATAQVKIEFARPVLQAAAAEIGHGDAQSRARISHAKLVAVEAADVAARTSLQVHGAMGYSWEVDVHLFVKRALALTYAWGGPTFHRARVGRRVFGHKTGPDQTFAREQTHA